MNLKDWLPCFPWEGPPLPRFLGIVWPWLQAGGQSFNLSPALKQYVASVEESGIVAKKPATIFSNTQDTKIERDGTGRIARIITHRKVVEGEEEE